MLKMHIPQAERVSFPEHALRAQGFVATISFKPYLKPARKGPFSIPIFQMKPLRDEWDLVEGAGSNSR